VDPSVRGVRLRKPI